MAQTARDVLVTGGAGFLGSHLCERLVRRGCTVYCLDNFCTGSIEHVAHLLDEPGFRMIEQDVTKPVALQVDEIYNLACPASPVHYQHDPIQTTRTCVLGALNMLELAQRCRAVVVQASTSEVYGEPSVHPQKESYWGYVNCAGLRSCYDEGKRCAESLFFDYRRRYGVAIKVARIFNTYGPRMAANDGRVVSNFVVQALTGQDLTAYGDGSQTRSFCYVDDLIEALLLLARTPARVTGPINLGNPTETTIAELAELVLHLTGSSSRVVYQALPQDDPTRRRPDITRARRILHWQPKTPLRAGLRQTIAHFEQVLSQESTSFAS